MRPTFKFLFAHPAHVVAFGFGSGLAPVAPGTFGTLFAWATYPLLRLAYPDDVQFFIFLGFMAAFGTWCVHVTGRHLGEHDHGAIVWDEILPFWAILTFVPPMLVDSPHGVFFLGNGFAWQLAAFALFRLFDIVKPPPAGYIDRRVTNGIGVMMDDVVAAAYALLSLAILKSLVDRIL